MAHDLADLALTRLDGSSDSLAHHAGKVLLVVNVASQCGLTPQYEGLEALYETYRDQGFEVLGFPANDFGNQEPGSSEDISQFCKVNYGVSFPLFTKAPVSGEDKQPLYAALIAAAPTKQGDPDAFRAQLKGYGIAPNEDPEVLWNFEKFLIGRNGQVVSRFAPLVAPSDPLLVSAIEAQLTGEH